MAEGGEGSDAGGVNEVAGVGEDVDVGSEGPDLGGRDQWDFLMRGGGFEHREGWRIDDRVLLTFCPAIRQRDSVESAWERRRVVSRTRDRWVSRSDWLQVEPD